MIHSSIAIWLFVFGGITGLLVLQFLFPRWYSGTFNKIAVETAPEAFYSRQAGLAIAVQGALLVWAGFEPALRIPAAVLVGLGKATFVVTILLHLKRFPGLLVSAVIDAFMVVVLALFLAGF